MCYLQFACPGGQATEGVEGKSAGCRADGGNGILRLDCGIGRGDSEVPTRSNAGEREPDGRVALDGFTASQPQRFGQRRCGITQALLSDHFREGRGSYGRQHGHNDDNRHQLNHGETTLIQLLHICA